MTLALALTTEQVVFLQYATEASKPLSILHAKAAPELRKLAREQIVESIVQPLELGKLLERHTYPNGKYGFRPSKLGGGSLAHRFCRTRRVTKATALADNAAA